VESLQSLIGRLGLQPLPREGGWFRRYFVSPECDVHGRPRRSAIHFAMALADFSALHRLATPEIWTTVDGAPVELVMLSDHGPARTVRLGRNHDRGEQRSVEVPGGVWQGARTTGEWSLVDCAMEPAWVENEFELGDRGQLAREFPAAADLIAALTRVPGER
jgi:hypothetical protein